jgi:hypothetical protein
LVWGTDISVDNDVDNVLQTLRTSPGDVDSDGDFYVDFYAGIITAYKVPSNPITLEINNNNMTMFGVGVPWGTHNVIPHWNQTTICNVVKSAADTATTSTYTLTLPKVSASSRVSTNAPYFGKKSYQDSVIGDAQWNMNSGESAWYRLPPAITDSAVSAGDQLPDGYCLLWDGDKTGRVIPQVTFYYLDEHSLTLVTPLDWLNQGDNYRLIISGTSAAEAINYLMQAVRNNEHNGITANPTLSYTIPISHSNLTNRFTGEITPSLSDIDRWKFRESDYPTNYHPQYLHRGGYMADDLDGNTGNAMRGDIVFSEENDFDLGTTDGFATQTYGVLWGDPGTDTCSMRFTGGPSSATGDKLYFGHPSVGANVHSSTHKYGALECSPYSGLPLYIRGRVTGSTVDYRGATLAFDLGRDLEMNYVKLLVADRDSTKDPVHLPANMSQVTWSTELDITPSLSNRLAPEQLREFRFRAVPKLTSASNTGIEASGEFADHFTGPAIVGADFLNVYSNAIFFSEQGDGKKTSFHERGTAWMNNSSTTNIPTGIYYKPEQGSFGARYEFTIYEDAGSGSQTYTPLKVGNDYGISLSSIKDINLDATVDVNIFGTARTNIESSTSSGLVLINSKNVTVNATGSLDVDSTSAMTIDSGTSITLTSTAGDITLNSGDDLKLNAPDYTYIGQTNAYL